MKLEVERNVRLPALAWVAEVSSDGAVLHVACGEAVEADEGGIIAGAWAGDFADREIAEAPTSVGTALRVTREGVVAVVGTAGAAPLHRYRSGRCVVLSNSLALALA